MARGQSGSASGGLPRGALRYQHCSLFTLTLFVLFSVTSLPRILSGMANFLLPPLGVLHQNLCFNSYLSC